MTRPDSPRARGWSGALVLAVTTGVVAGLGCTPATTTTATTTPSPEPGSTTTATTEPAPPSTTATDGLSATASFTRDGVALDWAPPTNLVFCRWYPEDERGDYVWIRFGETPERDGDAGPRLDVDVCRLQTGASGDYAPMPAGQHGSHCGAAPGFAIWWHVGEAAFNGGPSPDPEACALELEFDAEAETLRGAFACELAPAEHPGANPEAKTEPKTAAKTKQAPVHIVDGRFACALERVPVKNP